jgi:2'-5' RNA ligase
MKAALVLLSDIAVQNTARRIAVRLCAEKGLPFYAAALPSHVSLKQPFAFDDFECLDAFCERFAASVAPFDLTLDRFYLYASADYGVLGLNVVETPFLRGLHERLNAELAQVFADTRAAFDGADYSFHLTIEIARAAVHLPILREYFTALPDPVLDLRFTARELGVFFYPDETLAPGSFVVYRVLPLGRTEKE